MSEDSDPNPRCPRILFSEDELKRFYRPWSKALVVKVLERSFSFGAVKRRLENLWARNGSIQVSDASNSFFLVRFANSDDYQRAAFQGPWKIYDYYFSVARWSPSFNEEEPLQTILTWVRLPKLPIHFFNEVAVTRIGNCIGKTVRLDLATSEGARGRYARVCVEIDISKSLLGKYMIDDRTYFVEYESLSNICFTCGFYGHKAECCPSVHHPEKQSGLPEAEERVQTSMPTGETGEWMTVQRRSKSKVKKASAPSPNVPITGTRFVALADSEMDEGSGGQSAKHKTASQVNDPENTTSMLAAQLAEALAEAPCLKKHSGHKAESPKTKASPRPPLADVSNVPTKSATEVNTQGIVQQGIENSPELVSVPVIYDNPTFQGLRQTFTTSKATKTSIKRAKGVARTEKLVAPPKTKEKGGKQIRAFVPRTSDEGDRTKAGEPPDRS
ncbi:hypothetical protein LINPERHAP2_LOCUS28727 [Linum perenne]